MKKQPFSFLEWKAIPSSNLLINKDKNIRVGHKVMQLLALLAEANGEVVSRDTLINEIWKNVVTDDALTNVVAHLRKALNDTGSKKRLIETVPKTGYRLIPQVTWLEASTDSQNANSYQQKGTESTSVDSKASQPQKPSIFSNWRVITLLLFAILFLIYLISSKIVNPDSEQLPAQASTQISKQISKQDTDNQMTSQSVAVLPFDVYSNDEEVRFFASGLTEELIHQLAANPNLKVISRTSSSKFAGQNTDIKTISKILGARYVIEGSIRQSGDILRTTVQLIDAQNDFHMWSKTFDNKSTALFLNTQTEISEKVSLLITKKSDNIDTFSSRKHPKSSEAYRLFLLGQSYMRLGKVENYQKALSYYQSAIDIAPNYALAYSEMAAIELLLFQYAHTSESKSFKQASLLLDKAFSIEPQLPEAYAVRGLLNTYAKNYKRAEQDYLTALRINPGLRIARHNYGYLLSILNRTEESIIQWKIALEIDPLSARTNYGIADSLIDIGQIELGIKQFLSCQELLPKDDGCFRGLATVYGLLDNKQQLKYFLQQASARGNPEDFWQLLIESNYEIRVNNIEAARRLVDLALEKNPFSYHALKIDFSLQLKTNNLEHFSNKIASLSLRQPKSVNVSSMIGLSAFHQKNCSLAIMHYEKARNERSNALLNVWDWVEGISHHLNLAYCYQQVGDTAAAEKALTEYKNYIQKLPDSQHVIPGKTYNNARYLLLVGETIKASEELEKLNNWSFIWLADKDPIVEEFLINQ